MTGVISIYFDYILDVIHVNDMDSRCLYDVLSTSRDRRRSRWKDFINVMYRYISDNSTQISALNISRDRRRSQ